MESLTFPCVARERGEPFMFGEKQSSPFLMRAVTASPALTFDITQLEEKKRTEQDMMMMEKSKSELFLEKAFSGEGRKKGNTELCSEPSQNKVFLTLEDGYMSISMDKRYDLSPYLLAKHSDRHSFTDELDSFPTKYDWESQELYLGDHNSNAPIEADFPNARVDTSRESGDDEEQDIYEVMYCQKDVNTFVNLLQRCIQRDLAKGRELQLLIVINGLESIPYLAACVIRMFSSFDLLSEAQRVFKKLSEPDVFAWSAIIAAHAGSGENEEALALYYEMCDSSVEADGHVFVAALKVCSSLGRLEEGRVIHCSIIESGLESDVYVGSTIISMYSNCRCVLDALVVFERLPERNIVTWSALIKGYCQQNYGEEALVIFMQMQKEGMDPDRVIYVTILKACTSVSFAKAKQIHAEIIGRGFESDEWICNALVDMYSQYHDVDATRIMFNRLQKQDIVACSAFVSGFTHYNRGYEAIQVYKDMRHAGIQPDLVIFLCILKACTSTAVSDYGKHVHAHIIEDGLESRTPIVSALIDLHAKCGKLEDALVTFSRIPSQDIAVWNALMTGYSQQGYDKEVFILFDLLQEEGLEPDSITFVSVLRACDHMSLEYGRKIYSYAIQKGLESDGYISNALVDLYSKAGSFGEAHAIFDQHPNQDVVGWSSLIGGYVQHNRHQEALHLFKEMQENSVKLDPVVFACILKACSSIAELDEGRCLHGNIINNGWERDEYLGSILIEMYSKCGSLEDAYTLFYKLESSSVVAWNAMIAAYIQHDDPQAALRLFKEMEGANVDRNLITFVCSLKACSNITALGKGQQIHRDIIDRGFELDVIAGSTLINMYAKCGIVEDAHLLFNKLQNKNIVTWSALLAGYAHNGDYCSAKKCFEAMQQAGFYPDDVAFLSLFSACSHDVDSPVNVGCMHFKSMRDDYGIKPKVEHYNSMLELFGDAGLIHQAEDLLETIPCSRNTIGWTSLLNSCKVHGSLLSKSCDVDTSALDIGKRCFDHIVNLDVANAAGYVLMSSIYAKAGMMEDAKRVQELRKHVNGWKKPAKSYIEIDSEVHSFIVGDKVHPRSSEIYAKLKSLNKQMKYEGYQPCVDLIFGSESDEDKVTALCGHSEKLAIAFGLLSSPQGSTIRVSKNLRMCADCHTAAKLISKIEMREIVITDTYCVHRFLGGQCSCKFSY